MDFFARIRESFEKRSTTLCVGLDPRLDGNFQDPQAIHEAIFAKNKRIIDATIEYAACFKPNIAFYEAHGIGGMEALKRTIDYIGNRVPVLLDAKRCDIDATAKAYAKASFESLGADAITLSPYMGQDAVDPFLEYPEKAVFLLARTSNPRAGTFQDLIVRKKTNSGQASSSIIGFNEPLFMTVARECASWSDRVGLVVAGNDIESMRAVRAAVPNAWFLAPGIGTQGGTVEGAYAAGARADGSGIIPVAARSVADADDPGAAARTLCDSFMKAVTGNRAVCSPGFTPGKDKLKHEVLKGLIRTGCFKTGDFILKSGKHSPFYIDLRRVISDPTVLSLVAEAYASLCPGIRFDRLAGIPAAALPLATAAAMNLGCPMVWPRMPAKDHGTGVRVEGDFSKGERALLLDDLITTGASKLEAVEILRGEGLVVEDLLVLIERGKQGRKDMDNAGIHLHAFAHVREFFEVCEHMGIVDSNGKKAMEDFVEAE